MEEPDYRERLSREIARWVREGLITPAQSEAILVRIGAAGPRKLGALRMGWLVTAVSVLGAIALGAGVVLFVAANWQQMPDWCRTALVISAMMSAYTLGYVLMYRYDMRRLGSAFLLLGALLYEAGLLVAAPEISDLTTDLPAIFALAAAGVLPLAYLFDSRIVLLLAVANASLWVYWEAMPPYPSTTETFSALAAIGPYGVALYAIGRIHGARRGLQRFADVYVLVGVLIAMVPGYAFTFPDVWDAIREVDIDAYSAPAIIYIVVGIAISLVVVQRLLRGNDLETNIDTAFQAGIVGLTAVVATWPDWGGWALLFNVAYFSVAAAIITRGYLRGDEGYINLGLATVALGLLTRYVDAFWSVLADSLFFIVGGLLLLAIAFALERTRRGLLRGMDQGTQATTLPTTSGGTSPP
jgi:uncharacterized membrane protein